MRLRFISLITSVLLFVACGNRQTEQIPTAQYPTITVGKSSIELSESYPATIQGQQDVDIYPQVSGTISRLCVKEGERVKQGQILFVIDQVPYQAALRTAIANVSVAEAQVEVAKLEYDSKQVLFEEKIISEYDLSMAKSALSIAMAGVEQAKAQETNARNDLSYTEVKSPCNGIVGTLPYRVGALVNPSISQPLTTVSDTEQMFVYFSLTEREVINRMQQQGSFDNVVKAFPPVSVQMVNGEIYPLQGVVESISGVVDSHTGALSARAVFPNPNGMLLSGSTGRVIINEMRDSIIAIPQTATFEIMDKIYAYKVVDGVAQSTIITIMPISDGMNYVVTSGLNEGDIIVSEGAAYVREGMSIAINK